MTGRQTGRRRQAAWCLPLLLLITSAEACGGANHHLSDAGPCPTLKDSATTAVVHRAVLPLKTNPTFALPAVQRIGRPETVRRLATALCALPGLERGVDLPTCRPAVDYTVTFNVPHRRPVTVTIPTECRPITGLGPGRAIASRTRPWSALGTALGIPHATIRNFSTSPS